MKYAMSIRRTVTATLASAGICLAGAPHFALGGEAQKPAEKFEMQIFHGVAGATEIAAGDFSGAVEKIRLSVRRGSPYQVNTQLCVALTLERKFTEAEAHCLKAKRYSTQVDSRWAERYSGYLPTRQRQAIALNNLGVMHALQGNAGEAMDYFKTAEHKTDKLGGLSRRNMQALEFRRGSDVASSS